eukprot:3079127-Prymnesium_polylepis.1
MPGMRRARGRQGAPRAAAPYLAGAPAARGSRAERSSVRRTAHLPRVTSLSGDTTALSVRLSAPVRVIARYI